MYKALIKEIAAEAIAANIQEFEGHFEAPTTSLYTQIGNLLLGEVFGSADTLLHRATVTEDKAEDTITLRLEQDRGEDSPVAYLVLNQKSGEIKVTIESLENAGDEESELKEETFTL